MRHVSRGPACLSISRRRAQLILTLPHSSCTHPLLPSSPPPLRSSSSAHQLLSIAPDASLGLLGALFDCAFAKVVQPVELHLAAVALLSQVIIWGGNPSHPRLFHPLRWVNFHPLLLSYPILAHPNCVTSTLLLAVASCCCPPAFSATLRQWKAAVCTHPPFRSVAVPLKDLWGCPVGSVERCREPC